MMGHQLGTTILTEEAHCFNQILGTGFRLFLNRVIIRLLFSQIKHSRFNGLLLHVLGKGDDLFIFHKTYHGQVVCSQLLPCQL